MAPHAGQKRARFAMRGSLILTAFYSAAGAVLIFATMAPSMCFASHRPARQRRRPRRADAAHLAGLGHRP